MSLERSGKSEIFQKKKADYGHFGQAPSGVQKGALDRGWGEPIQSLPSCGNWESKDRAHREGTVLLT